MVPLWFRLGLFWGRYGDKGIVLKTGLEKPKRYRNNKYLEYIRKQDCVSCGKPSTPDAPNVAHHARRLAPGEPGSSKVSDLCTVSLCQIPCHVNEHTGFGMDILELYQSAFDLLRTWVEEKLTE